MIYYRYNVYLPITGLLFKVITPVKHRDHKMQRRNFLANILRAECLITLIRDTKGRGNNFYLLVINYSLND